MVCAAIVLLLADHRYCGQVHGTGLTDLAASMMPSAFSMTRTRSVSQQDVQPVGDQKHVMDDGGHERAAEPGPVGGPAVPAVAAVIPYPC